MTRWLVVGAGAVGQAHAAAIRRLDGAVLAGFVSADPVADPGVPVHSELAEALAALRPDAVVVATPHDTHHALGTIALSAGYPTLFEKPVGRTTEEARALAALSRARAVPAGAVLNQRACSHHAWIRDRVHDGRLRVTSASFSGSLARLTGWHADPRRAGGGVLRTIGIHYVDLLRWWLGEPVEVRALLAGAPAEDRVVAGMRFADGALGGLQLAATAQRSLGPMRGVIEADGVRLELAGHELARVEGLPGPPPAEPALPGLSFGPGHLAVLREATAALAAGRPFPVTLDDVLPTLALVDRLYASALAGERPGRTADQRC